MTPEYRYYTADLLTGNVLGEMPFYGVYLSRALNEAGTFTGTVKLGSDRHIDQDLLDATIPGRTAVYVERNGELIWGGIIWSRTYAAESKTANLTGQTFESIFDHVVMESHFIMQNVDQAQIFENLINTIQAQASNNFSLSGLPFTPTGIKRTVLVPGYEYQFCQTIVEQIVGVDDGLEYTIDVVPSASIDRPNKVVRVGYPKLGTQSPSDDLFFDYPGTIAKYWWPESATRGATKVAAIGHGTGVNTIRATAVDGDMINAGWPAWWQVTTHANIADVDGIAAKARGDLDTFRAPYSRPTVELKSDIGVGFKGWNELGSILRVRFEDARFPNGFETNSRMLGWELTTSDSNSAEVLKFIIEGKEDD